MMSVARHDTWMPIFWGDYLRDTGHLSAAEHGAYLMLIAHYWTTGKGLPADDGQLARIARMSKKEWAKARPVVSAFFKVTADGWLHKRIEQEIENAQERVERRSKAGKKGAETRWNTDAIANGNRIAAAPQSHKQNDGQSQSQSQSPKEIAKQAVDSLRASRAGTGVNYDDAEVRKARWVQKIISFLYQTRPDDEARAIVNAYTAGQQVGIIAFETADKAMRAAEKARGTYDRVRG
jgi:uncharacterized protein YdaU (DUF1376 family)